MATIKSHTDLLQSKKLAKILPIKSADMHYIIMGDDEDPQTIVGLGEYIGILPTIPCWSLAVLLDILPDRTCVYKKSYKDGRVKYKGVAKGCKELILKDNPIDACYEMILNLHEQKLL